MEPSDSDAEEPLWLNRQSLLSTADHELMAIFVRQFFSANNEDRQEARMLYQDCLKKSSSTLSLKLCKFYLFSRYDPRTRVDSMYVLDDLLNMINQTHKFFSPSILHELKPILVSCLRLHEDREIDFEIISNVVSAISVHVFKSEDGKWDDLRDYIAAKIESDFRKVFLLFHKLPAVLNYKFLTFLAEKVSPAIVGKLNLSHGDFKDWVLAFNAGFTFCVHMAGSPRSDLSNNMLYEMMRSAVEIVNEGLERFLKRALRDLADAVEKGAEKYCRRQNEFVNELVRTIGEIPGMKEHSLIVARKFSQAVEGTSMSMIGVEGSVCFSPEAFRRFL